MKKHFPFRYLISFLLLSLFWTSSYAFDNLFYTLRYTSLGSQAEFNSILSTLNTHANDVQVLVSQAYRIRADGNLDKGFNPRLLNFANEHGIKFMAMVCNPGDLTHAFLQNKKAESNAIAQLLRESAYYHLYGVQIDFENVSVKDKKALTNFYQQLASALHKNKFAISIAITPRITDDTNSAFQAARYANWTGAFDYKALGASSDFVTLMAYDQHNGATTPGPIATLPWAEAVIQYGLKYIPAHKISLGIPTYSGFWKTARHGRSLLASGEQIDYQTLQSIVNRYHPSMHWDEKEGVDYAFYEHNELNEFIFAEDARSFAAKYNLAKRYNLRGISVWRVGVEDPKIWAMNNPQ